MSARGTRLHARLALLLLKHQLSATIALRSTMASRLFSSTLFNARVPLFALGLGASSGILIPQLLQTYQSRHALRLDSSSSSVSAKDWSFSQYQADAKAPIVKNDGKWNARAIRQMSTGSIIGTSILPVSQWQHRR